MPQQLRFKLGDLVFSKRWESDPPMLCMVAGSWRWSKSQRQQERLMGVCPTMVEYAQGYVLLPTKIDEGYRIVFFGSAEIDELYKALSVYK